MGEFGPPRMPGVFLEFFIPGFITWPWNLICWVVWFPKVFFRPELNAVLQPAARRRWYSVLVPAFVILPWFMGTVPVMGGMSPSFGMYLGRMGTPGW